MTHLHLRSPLHRGTALFLSAVLLAPGAAFAQAPAATPAAPPAATTQSLRILPLAGNNGVNDLERQVMSPLAVQILDLNDRPVAGATVIFRFPLNGPSAAFANNQTSQTMQTGANGQALASGWKANSMVGSFAVQVTASRGTEQGIASILMNNVPKVIPESEIPKKRWWTSKWAKIAYIGAAGAITTGIVLSKTGSTTITGTVGAPTIGGPQ